MASGFGVGEGVALAMHSDPTRDPGSYREARCPTSASGTGPPASTPASCGPGWWRPSPAWEDAPGVPTVAAAVAGIVNWEVRPAGADDGSAPAVVVARRFSDDA